MTATNENIHQHHQAEAGILLREFKEAGFDPRRLIKNSVFATALSQYGGCQMTRDELFNVAHMLVIFNPELKSKRKRGC